jgi:hypothetical protein
MRIAFTYIGLVLLAASAVPAIAAPQDATPPSSEVADGAVKAVVRIDRDAAQVAEPIRLTLEVTAPKGTRVKLPQLGQQLGEFAASETNHADDIPVNVDGSQRTWTLEASLDTIKTGAVTIPSLPIHYTTEADATTFKTLETKPLTIEIKSVLENRADPTKFRDIQGTVDVPLPLETSYAWVGWTAAGLGGAVAIALVTLAVAKRRRGPSPAAWALAAIADLEKLPIANSADAEAAYNEVVDVLREFFELEFGVPTLARTTREFLAEAAKTVGLEKSSRDRLSSLASIADEIKFARLSVGESQVHEALTQAKSFIAECEAHRRAAEKEAA